MSTTTLTTEDTAIFNRLHLRYEVVQGMRAAHSTDYRAMLAREQDKADARDAAEWSEAAKANNRAEAAYYEGWYRDVDAREAREEWICEVESRS